MYIEIVAPIILTRKLNISVDEAREIVLSSLSEEALDMLSDDEKQYLGITND